MNGKPVPDQTSQLELMKELLRQRGLLATGGNIRSLPFDEASSFSSSGATGTGTTPSTGAGSVPRPEGQTPIIGPDQQLLDPTTQKPLPPEAASEWWKYLLAGAGIAGGVVLTDALRRRMGSTSRVGPDGVPLVEGETITDPLGALPNSQTPIEGEFTEVGDTLAGRKAANGISAPAKQLTSRNRPRANPRATSDTSVVRLPDQMSDIPPEELARARALAQELVARRMKGNANPRLAPRRKLPTGTENEETLLNTIIGIMRSNGATRILPRVIQ